MSILEKMLAGAGFDPAAVMDQAKGLQRTIEAIGARLSSIDGRLANIENHLAERARRENARDKLVMEIYAAIKAMADEKQFTG